jgi:hypothetical protein
MSQLTAIRLLDADEPAQPLLEAVRDLAEGQPNEAIYQVEPTSFRQVPNAPFAYWVSEHIRGLFAKLSPFESEGRTAKLGGSSKNDFRFLRLEWEIPQVTRSHSPWYLHAKGGAFSPFYSDIFLTIKWENNASEIEAEVLKKFPYLGTNAEFVLHRNHPHLNPGLTWPSRTTSGMSMRVLPKGVVFGNKGPAAFTENENNLPSTLSLCQSAPFQSLIALQLAAADTAARSYEVGIIKSTVVPLIDEQSTNVLGNCARSAWSTKRSTDTDNQTSHAFYAPALSPGQFGSRRKDLTPA